MWSIVTTAAILVALAANHVVNGPGCWGLQPGGRNSMLLYLLQMTVAAAAGVHALGLLARTSAPRRNALAGLLLAAVASVGALYGLRGWCILTSLHNMGAENLLPFLAASFSALLAGRIIGVVSRPPQIRADPKPVVGAGP
jgi:hypothetical protein